MDFTIPKMIKGHLSKLEKLIIPLARPEKDGLEPSEYIDHTSHNTSTDCISGKYIMKIPRFGSDTPEE